MKPTWGDILHCDAKGFFGLLPSHIIRAIFAKEITNVHLFTSPPYNRGVKYADGINDRLHMSEWHRLLYVVVYQFFEIAKGVKHCSAWLQFDDLALDDFMRSELLPYYDRQKFVWVKSMTPEDGSPSWGHFRPRQGDTPHNAWEWVVRLSDPRMPSSYGFDRKAEGLGVAPIDQRNVKRFPSCANGRRCRGDVWEAKLETRQKMQHPCPFPALLPEFALRGMGVGPNSLVLDPFCGTGSTGVAALKLGARFVGGDLSITYCKIALERLNQCVLS